MNPLDKLSDLLDIPQLKEVSRADTFARRDELKAVLADRLKTQTTKHWLAILESPPRVRESVPPVVAVEHLPASVFEAHVRDSHQHDTPAFVHTGGAPGLFAYTDTLGAHERG